MAVHRSRQNLSILYRCDMIVVMLEMSMTEARAQLADLANKVAYGGERVVLTRHGKPFVALILAADLALLDAPRSAGVESAAGQVLELGVSPQAHPLQQIAAAHETPPGEQRPSSW